MGRPERAEALDVKCKEAVLRADHPAQSESRAVWCIVFLLMTGVLLSPAIWNGFPLLEYDTGGYLARWFEGYLVPSRPAAYGLLLAAAAHFEFWPVLVAQAAATIWILGLLMRELGLGARPLLFTAVIISLTFATTLPWLTSILLTDIFAGLAVLSLHLLVFGRSITPRQRCALAVFIGFAAATHSATLALVATLVCLVVVLPRSLLAPARARHALLTLVLAVIMTLSANCIVSGRFEFTPGGYGIVFSRMLEDGIVSRYLMDHCPDSSLKLCPFRHQLPSTADDFLWGDSVFDRLGRFAGLSEEMRRIVLGSLREYPLLQIETALAATATQLARVATGEGVVNTIWHTYGIFERYAPAVIPTMRAARQQRGEIQFRAINYMHVPIALISVALLPALLAAGWKWSRLSPLGVLAATIATALLANAFVCGALANPHDRYGARLTWLAPMAIILVPICIWAPASGTGGMLRRRSYAIGGNASEAMQDAAG
jgi:hypothetical protein